MSCTQHNKPNFVPRNGLKAKCLSVVHCISSDLKDHSKELGCSHYFLTEMRMPIAQSLPN